MRPELEKRLNQLVQRDARRRRDPRFLDTMGFLVAKGFLGYNRPIPERPNAKLDLRAAIWAGVNVEPRILEVLPAAFARFERHFILPPLPNVDERLLVEIRTGLSKKQGNLPDFFDIPYTKYGIWLDLPLSDRRTRPLSKRKRMKAFRLHPDAIKRLAELAALKKMSEAEILEELIGKYP